MNLLRQASDWLRRTRKEHAADDVTYQRGPASASLRATFGRVTYDVVSTDHYQVPQESWDFLIDAADLELDGVAAAPKVGDRILVGDLGDALLYEVNNVAGRCWAWSDSFQATYRVHTKLVGRQPPAPR
jgi:hypothetical protein